MHEGEHFGVIPGLGDVAINFALIDGCHGGGDVGITGEEDAHHLRPAFAHLLEEGGAVHFRHAHIGNYQVNMLFSQNFQAGGTAFGDENAIAVRPEEAAQGG